MKNDDTFQSLIDALPDNFESVKPSKKDPSVREAILLLREPLGGKVFTKEAITLLLEARFPHLAPVKTSSLEVSLGRVKEHLECKKIDGRNHYRFRG